MNKNRAKEKAEQLELGLNDYPRGREGYRIFLHTTAGNFVGKLWHKNDVALTLTNVLQIDNELNPETLFFNDNPTFSGRWFPVSEVKFMLSSVVYFLFLNTGEGPIRQIPFED